MRLWLKKLRKQRKLSQIQIAEALEISQHYYSRIETGCRQKELTFSIVIKIADFYKISLNTIRKFEEEMRCDKQL